MSEFYKSTLQKNRESFDRYKNCPLLIDNETNEVLVGTRDIDLIKRSTLDKYHTVSPSEELRLDIIADTYYSNPLLWWVLAQANDIYDPLTRPLSGEIIRIPNIATLYGTGGVLL